MRKIIAAMNMTLDGFCDHTEMNADDEIHQHYTELLKSADTVLYGRITFQLMEYWRTVVIEPTGNKATDEFAVVMDNIQKIVFSRTLKNVNWETAILKKEINREEISALKESDKTGNKDILVGSPSMIVALTNLHLIDEYQLGVHPTILGTGLQLFKNIIDRVNLRLLKTKTFQCGAVHLNYESVKE